MSRKNDGNTAPYSPMMRNKVLCLIRKGMSVNAIGKLEGFPSSRAIHEWVEKDEKWALKYVCAKEAQVEIYVSSIIDANKQMLSRVIDSDNLNAAVRGVEVYSQNMRWHAEITKPKRYNRAFLEERERKKTMAESAKDIHVNIISAKGERLTFSESTQEPTKKLKPKKQKGVAKKGVKKSKIEGKKGVKKRAYTKRVKKESVQPSTTE